jgi:hypothetical protein
MVKPKTFILVLFLLCLYGCYAGSVKPLLDRPDFKNENEPVRTLKVVVVADHSYPRKEIEKFVSTCSGLTEKQVGVKLEIMDLRPIEWGDELADIVKMEARIAAETWTIRGQFDVAFTFSDILQKVEGGKTPIGATDTFFWRYIFVKELDPYILLHELFHAFLLENSHSEKWVMKSARPAYGGQWYWLTPEDRRTLLRNKWRDFNIMPAGRLGEREWKESWFCYEVGLASLRGRAFDQAASLFTRCLELSPKKAEAYQCRGFCYTMRQQYDRAIVDFNRALEINPGYAEAYLHRGEAYYHKGEYENSWQDLQQARRLGFEPPTELLRNLRRAIAPQKG